MDIYIELLTDKDAEELYRFEMDNRAFFEKMVPSRGEEYYHFATFKRILTELLKEQNEGISYFYLIRNADRAIVGRMNLVDIDKISQIGNIGYRVGESYIGKGIAQKALNLLLQRALKYNVNELHAKTTIQNIASQKVLEKNEFSRKCMVEEEDEQGQQETFVHYIWNQHR